MLILEFKVNAKTQQYDAINEAIRTTQFVRNKCLRYWMDNEKVTGHDLNKYCAVLAKEFGFAKELNSQARQSAAERAWLAISRFFNHCKKKVAGFDVSAQPNGKKGYPKFQNNNRSVEYKTTGWSLPEDRKHITFTDKKNIGRVKLLGSRDLGFYQPEQIKRVRLVKRADGYTCQFAVSVDREEVLEPAGLDVGLNSFYTDSEGVQVENPRFYRLGEAKMKRAGRLVSRKQKGSGNRRKARIRLGRTHLKISRRRKDHACKLARSVITSNDVVVYEDLRVSNLVRNHCLAKSINDAGWYQFRLWIEYFAKVFGRLAVPVNPAYTSQECSECGVIVKKSLSTRTHVCQCGCKLDRDHNAAINILNKGLNTLGHKEIYAWGEMTSTVVGAILL